jgi:hypothetical protein
MKTDTQNSKNNGFSLFEAMMCVCVMGLMALMALPLFGSTEGTRQATHRKNAQTLCTLAASANAAGAQVTAGTRDIATIIRRLGEGVTITRGPLAGRVFRLPNLSEEDVLGAVAFIRLNDGELIYTRAR